MSVKIVTLKGGRKVQIYMSDTVTDKGTYCSATLLRPNLGNKLIGSKYLRKLPKDPATLVRRLEQAT